MPFFGMVLVYNYIQETYETIWEVCCKQERHGGHVCSYVVCVLICVYVCMGYVVLLTLRLACVLLPS